MRITYCLYRGFIQSDNNTATSKYSQHHLIQPLVIQSSSLIELFPLDTLHWLPMLKASLNSTPHKIRSKIFTY